MSSLEADSTVIAGVTDTMTGPATESFIFTLEVEVTLITGAGVTDTMTGPLSTGAFCFIFVLPK